jgi:predicted house-cleaning noncanonical NTP pyrophosphatase (MazG superfamily)
MLAQGSHQSGYMTPPSETKKKTLILLQNAPSSRKGQSTLDTSPEIKPKCFEDDLSTQPPKDSEFSQALFKKLLNECDTKITDSNETNTVEGITTKTLLDVAAKFANMFNSRDKAICELFVN